MQEMQETQVRSLGWEDPLEKEMATHFSILARKIPWTEEPRGLQFMGLQRVGYNCTTKCAYVYTHTHTISLKALTEKISICKKNILGK